MHHGPFGGADHGGYHWPVGTVAQLLYGTWPRSEKLSRSAVTSLPACTKLTLKNTGSGCGQPTMTSRVTVSHPVSPGASEVGPGSGPDSGSEPQGPHWLAISRSPPSGSTALIWRNTTVWSDWFMISTPSWRV